MLLTLSGRLFLMLSRTEAIRLMRGHLKIAEARKHSLAVARIMEQVARKLKTDEEEWHLCGLLHDIDRDKIHGDMSKHGIVAAELLEGLISKDCLHAIRAHDHRTGVIPRNIMDKALIASDAVARFFAELADREEIRQAGELNSSAFLAKFEDRPFKKLGYLRKRIEICREIGIPLEEFLRIAREAFETKDARPV